jgi:hypothetical protein
MERTTDDYTNGYGEWIYDQCCKNGELTLDKAKIGTVFGSGDKGLIKIKGFCGEKHLVLHIDPSKTFFTFELPNQND